MKNKKLTIASVILSVCLVSALTIGVLATVNYELLSNNEVYEDNDNNHYEPRHYALSENSVIVELDIIEDTTNSRFINIEVEELTITNEQLLEDEHQGFSESSLYSVSAYSERFFSPEAWAEILMQVETGEVKWVD